VTGAAPDELRHHREPTCNVSHMREP
jgi:hypothetical protein